MNVACRTETCISLLLKIQGHDSNITFEYNSGINHNTVNMFLYIKEITNVF